MDSQWPIIIVANRPPCGVAFRIGQGVRLVISTVIYYYSTTGNSLYVARELQKRNRSQKNKNEIAYDLKKV